jgi:hypothetical protein
MYATVSARHKLGKGQEHSTAHSIAEQCRIVQSVPEVFTVGRRSHQFCYTLITKLVATELELDQPGVPVIVAREVYRTVQRSTPHCTQ